MNNVTPLSAKSGLWQLAVLFALAIGGVAVLLSLESQGILFGVVAILVVAWVVCKRSGLAKHAFFALHANPGAGHLMLIGGGLCLLVLFHEEHYSLLMIATVLLYASACIGINIQTGLAGLVNFAGAAFFTCGGYSLAVALQSGKIPGLLALICAGVAAALIGLVLLLPVLRTKGYYSALITIAFGILASSFLQVNETLGGAQGLQLKPLILFGWDMSTGFSLGKYEVSFYAAYVVLALALFVIASTLAFRIEWSFVGVNMDSTRSDELISSSFGVNLKYWKMLAFLVGNFIIGFAGAIYGAMTGFVSPVGATFEHSLLLLSMVVLGGIGNTWGVLIATFIVILLPEKLHALQEYRFLIFSIAVIVILLFSPKGLMPRAIRDFSIVGGRHE